MAGGSAPYGAVGTAAQGVAAPQKQAAAPTQGGLSMEERAWYAEADKRGLLKPEEKAWWSEYQNRFEKKIGMGEAAVLGAADSLSFNNTDEIAAPAISAAKNIGQGNFGDAANDVARVGRSIAPAFAVLAPALGTTLKMLGAGARESSTEKAVKADIRERQRKARSERPVTYYGSGIAAQLPLTGGSGAVGSTFKSMAPAVATKARPIVGALTRGAVDGAAAGAASAIGDAQDEVKGQVGTVISGATAGAGGALLFGGSAQAVRGALGSATKILPRYNLTPDQRAVRIIAKRLKQDGAKLKTPPATGGANAEGVFEMGGQNVRGLARAAANIPGQSKTKAEDFFAKRRDGVWGRIMSAATKATGSDAKDFAGYLKATKKLRADEADVFYSAAYADPPPAQIMDDIRPIMETMDGRKAASLALRLLDSKRGATKDPAELADIDAAMRFLKGAARGDVSGQNAAPNMRALDYLGRGLRDVIGPRMRTGQTELATGPIALRERLIGAMRNSSRAFDQAFGNYGDRSSQIDFAELGRKALNMDDIEISDALADATLAEKDAFAIGTARAIMDALNRNDNALVFKFRKSKAIRDALELSMGPANFKKFQGRMAREAAMRDSDNSINAGSRTTPLAEDIRAATDGESELGFVNDIISAGGSVKGPAVRAAARAYDRWKAPGLRNDKVNAAVGERLFQPATKGRVDALNQEIEDVMRLFEERVNLLGMQGLPQAAARAGAIATGPSLTPEPGTYDYVQ